MGIGGVRSEIPVIVRFDREERTVPWRRKRVMVVVMLGVGVWLTTHLPEDIPPQRNSPTCIEPPWTAERHSSAEMRLRVNPRRRQSLPEKDLAPDRP